MSYFCPLAHTPSPTTTTTIHCSPTTTTRKKRQGRGDGHSFQAWHSLSYLPDLSTSHTPARHTTSHLTTLCTHTHLHGTYLSAPLHYPHHFITSSLLLPRTHFTAPSPLLYATSHHALLLTFSTGSYPAFYYL